MSNNERIRAVLDILAGRSTTAVVAKRLAVPTEEVELWRELYLDAVERNLELPRGLGRFKPLVGALATASTIAAVLAIIAWPESASSQVACTQTLPSPMTTFCADTPALASEVNGNFQQLVSWTEQKVGGFGSNNIDVTGTLSYGSSLRQMENYWGTEFGTGVQSSTLYQRSARNFAWYAGGSHSNSELDPGTGGSRLMSLSSAGLNIASGVSANSVQITGTKRTVVASGTAWASCGNSAVVGVRWNGAGIDVRCSP